MSKRRIGLAVLLLAILVAPFLCTVNKDSMVRVELKGQPKALASNEVQETQETAMDQEAAQEEAPTVNEDPEPVEAPVEGDSPEPVEDPLEEETLEGDAFETEGMKEEQTAPAGASAEAEGGDQVAQEGEPEGLNTQKSSESPPVEYWSGEEASDDDSAGQDETGAVHKVRLSLPKSLSGYSVFLRDPNGNQLSEGIVDASGMGELSIDPSLSESTLVVNTTRIESLGRVDAKPSYTQADLILYVIPVSAVLFGIGFWIGRRSGIKLLRNLRDYIYEEDLD